MNSTPRAAWPAFIPSPSERRVGRIMRNPDPEGHVTPLPPPAPTPPPPAPETPPAIDAAELERLRAENARLAADAARFDGLDPDAARTAITEREAAAARATAAEREAAEAAGNWERVRELMNTERDAREAALNAQITALTTERDASRAAANDGLVTSAFAGSEFVTKKMALPQSKVRQLYGAHTEVEDGAIVVYDQPRGAAKRTKLVDGKGNALGFDAAMERIINADPDKDRLLASTIVPGPGSRPSDAPAPDAGKSRQQRLAEGIAALRGTR